MKQLEEFQALAKQQGEKPMALMSDLATQYQELLSAHAEQSSAAFHDGSAFLEKLARAQSLEHAMEIQAEYRKSARETFAEQSRRMADLYAGFFRTAFKPVGAMKTVNQEAG